ncbi:MAG: hypothetical protein ACRDD8_05360 [Bacteroidales bacterium]
MITISSFNESNRNFTLHGNVTKSTKLQGYSKNRTIGSKVRQRWIAKYDTYSIEVLAISESDFKKLEEFFLKRELLSLSFDGADHYATLVGDSLNFTDFENEHGDIFYKGTLELE